MSLVGKCLLVCLVCLPPMSMAASPGGCLSAEERELAKLINEYRDANGLPPVPVSRSLTEVAQWHTIDLKQNNPSVGACNDHSWSNARPGLWTAVCYTPDHANAAGMWHKPREITAGAYSDYGFENIHWHSAAATARSAFSGWSNSAGHRETILEQGIWNGMRWQSMGIGIYRNYAALWFAQAPDPRGTVGNCGSSGDLNSNPGAALTPLRELLLDQDN